MKRFGMVLLVFALAPLLMGGGMNPGSQQTTVKFSGATVHGVLVVDTHNGFDPVNEDFTQVTVFQDHGGQFEFGTKHKIAALRLQKGSAVASAIFRLPLVFRASLGCDPAATEARFVYSQVKPNTLRNIMPPGLLESLFAELGVDIATQGEPVVTSVANAACSNDPDNTATTNPGLTAPGILSADLVIQFVRP